MAELHFVKLISNLAIGNMCLFIFKPVKIIHLV
jgi:hypothetical protein